MTKRQIWVIAALAVILAVGAYFRFTGINWDQDQHQHPDERFMTMVAEKVRPVDGLGQYLNTELSSLNPLGYGFYTYGMWPLFLTRYAAEWVQKTGYDQIVLVGRALSGLFDLASVALLFLLGARLYGRRVGLLAAALYAAAVLPIQLSHFFAVDSFTTVFTIAALYAAVLVMERARWWAFAAFGLCTGLAMGAKVSMAPLAGLVVVAGLAYVLQARSQPGERRSRLKQVLVGWVIAGLCTAWVFRLAQPYAFLGPGLFGVRFNPRWLQIIGEVSDQVAGRSDFPPNHHWAGRPFSYGWTNMVQWGMGLPLGLAATAAWAWAAWRCWKGAWRRHLLPVLWVGGFFLWQSTHFWRYTRYFLPVYPFAILLAAWALVELIKRARAGRWAGLPQLGSGDPSQTEGDYLRSGRTAISGRQSEPGLGSGDPSRAAGRRRAALPGVLAALLLVGVVASTYAYAFAFTRIYTRPHTRVAASRWMYENLPGPVNVVLETPDGTRQIPLSMPEDLVLGEGEGWTASFSPAVSGRVTAVIAPHVSPVEPGEATALELELARGGREGEALVATTVSLDFGEGVRTGGKAQEMPLAPVPVDAQQEYALTLRVRDGTALTFAGAAIALESSWDDDLPLALDDQRPYAGLYRHLDLGLHEAATEAKAERMVEILDQADYIAIASNRSYDAMPRLLLRYPLTVAFYQALFGCASEDIASCAYPAAAPLQGDLGFDLVATFESYPTLGPWSIPDQRAQESFTVYDHPKVLVFAKTPDYSPARARALVEAVDLTQVVEQSATQVSQTPTGLRMPASWLAAQKAAGTWASMFSTSSLLNRSQTLGAAAWYLLLLLLGWLAYPLVFSAFPGLSDRGYAVARLVGLLVVAWLAWLAGSYRVLPFSGATLWLCLALVAALAGLLAWVHRAALGTFVRQRWRYLLTVEGLFLALFLFGLVVRWNNPDLWHPWRGGEKPGDFALLNAVIKSVAFPPYDPWLAGQHVNYYYYGYVLSAMPIKLLGIVPAVAYNLLIPTWFALTGLGAFGVAYNLVARRPSSVPAASAPAEVTAAASAPAEAGPRGSKAPYVAGIVALALTVLLGNLYEFQMLAERLLTGGAVLAGADSGPWYFDASRAILNGQDAAPITEFPFFTFLYADLHPHLLDMPIVLAALAWLLSILRSPALLSRGASPRQMLSIGATWLVGGLIFGATYPTNAWDFPVMAGLAVVVVAYAVWTHSRPDTRATIEGIVLHVGLLLVLSTALYAPFRQWFGTGEQAVELWQGPRTPLSDYITVHGLFLFLLGTYLALETVRWLRPKAHGFIHTPLGQLVPALRRGSVLLLGGVAIALAGFPWSWRNDYQTVVFALPLALWAGLLLLRREQTAQQRFALLLVAAGIGLTVIAELFTLQGDVGRMNVVFKLYLLVWIFLSVAAGAALVWIWPSFKSGERRWIWWGMLAFLVVAASTYPVVGTLAKVRDRWPDVTNPPRTLDGMAFMLGERGVPAAAGDSAVYYDEGQELRLGRDYEAMRWMQEHIAGTPTIVEGHSPEYRWGSRYSVYTGLPTVAGWSWHLRQHNAVLPASVVEKRIEAVQDFYNGSSRDEALAFLARYQVDYVVVGELERARYTPEGLAKFPEMAATGNLQAVFPQQATGDEVTVYAVQPGR